MQLLEHVGSERAHDPHHWWIFDARETSPVTCPLCLSLHGSHYRGDAIDFAFPYHMHMHVNAIKARAHEPRDRNCRCVLRWAGRTKDILQNPYGVSRSPKVPKIPKTLRGRPVEDVMSKSDRILRKHIVKHARETFAGRRSRLRKLGK